MGEGSGSGSGRVWSDFLSAIAGRVWSTFRRVGSKESDPWTTLIFYISPFFSVLSNPIFFLFKLLYITIF